MLRQQWRKLTNDLVLVLRKLGGIYGFYSSAMMTVYSKVSRISHICKQALSCQAQVEEVPWRVAQTKYLPVSVLCICLINVPDSKNHRLQKLYAS